MSWRKRLAAWLDPETAEQANRYLYLSGCLSTLYQWCSYDFPVLGDAINWSNRRTQIYFMNLQEYAEFVRSDSYEIYSGGSIDRFREKLREKYLHKE